MSVSINSWQHPFTCVNPRTGIKFQIPEKVQNLIIAITVITGIFTLGLSVLPVLYGTAAYFRGKAISQIDNEASPLVKKTDQQGSPLGGSQRQISGGNLSDNLSTPMSPFSSLKEIPFLKDSIPLSWKNIEVSQYESHFKEVFEELKFFSKLEVNSSLELSPEHVSRFENLLRKIDQYPTYSLIKKNLIRLSKGHFDENAGWLDFKKAHLDSFSFLVRKLHEITELLFLKHEHNKDYDEIVGRDKFCSAHNNAISVENFLILCKAKELDMPLSLKALQYIRMFDQYGVISRTNFYKQNWKYNIAYYKPTGERPSQHELSDYIDFMTRSGLFKEVNERASRQAKYSHDVKETELNEQSFLATYLWRKWLWQQISIAIPVDKYFLALYVLLEIERMEMIQLFDDKELLIEKIIAFVKSIVVDKGYVSVPGFDAIRRIPDEFACLEKYPSYEGKELEKKIDSTLRTWV